MTSALNDVGIGGRGLSINCFAQRYGVSATKIKALCEAGAIQGAKKHPKTRQWWLYPPLKILNGLRGVRL